MGEGESIEPQGLQVQRESQAATDSSPWATAGTPRKTGHQQETGLGEGSSQTGCADSPASETCGHPCP